MTPRDSIEVGKPSEYFKLGGPSDYLMTWKPQDVLPVYLTDWELLKAKVRKVRRLSWIWPSALSVFTAVAVSFLVAAIAETRQGKDINIFWAAIFWSIFGCGLALAFISIAVLCWCKPKGSLEHDDVIADMAAIQDKWERAQRAESESYDVALRGLAHLPRAAEAQAEARRRDAE